MKQIKMIILICFSFVALQCSKRESNKAPSAANLIFPSDNLLCIDNTITFNWGTSIDPEENEVQYNIIIAKDRALTNIVENRTISAREVTIILEKETAYYWKVDALDIDNNQGTASETYAFFTQGQSTSNYAPFSSVISSPENSSQVTTNSVNLTWDAADANLGDTLTYEVFFGESSNPPLVDDNISSKSYSVSVESGKTYFWKVNVKDQNEAKSIGQVWTFSVN